MVLSNVKNVFQDMIWSMEYVRNGVWIIIVMNVHLIVIIVDNVMLVMSWVMVNVCRIWIVIILQNKVIQLLTVIQLLLTRLIILLLTAILQLITLQIPTQLKPIQPPTLQLTLPQTITQLQLILLLTIPQLIPQHKLSVHAKSAPKNIIYHQISPVCHVPLQTLTVYLAPWLHQKIVHNVHPITISHRLLVVSNVQITVSPVDQHHIAISVTPTITWSNKANNTQEIVPNVMITVSRASINPKIVSHADPDLSSALPISVSIKISSNSSSDSIWTSLSSAKN